ncbi:rhomboid family intramembrane serine protease [Ornithinibacillus bavariensis]|uniref:Rhomboid protease YdcA n=1 Tax=Ornithinibacillus bavariensis TaxID=545502 RepID=A0A919X708_9BACI|nr:rhomboid family intramembrane serine protease [Ornithinibacillus bavariensis]GIO27122.1 putative rhomboid protease YdcA [Ornithinibacillus bavariensis]
MFLRTEKSVKEFIQSYPIISTLVIINISIWILGLLPITFFDRLYDLGVGSHFDIQNGEYWRFLTPIFLHGGFTHMLFNSFSLILFGPALEQMLGRLKFILAYLGAGVLANIATFLLNPDLGFAHVGTSGAIYGLFGIYVFMVVFRKHLIDAQSAQIIVIIFIIGLIMTFIRPGINEYGHVLGFVSGFVIAPLLLTKARPFNPWKNPHSNGPKDIQFNPNRWKKKNFFQRLRLNPFFIFFIIVLIIFIVQNFF